MSDSIQSISQGNYILQGTVATSAGIVGDGSTQNPLRADETVLWSGTTGDANHTTAFKLSEPLSGFKRIRFEGYQYGQATPVYEITTPNNSTYVGVCFNYFCFNNDSNPYQIRCGSFSSTNGLDYTIFKEKFLFWSNTGLSAAGGTTTQGPNINKIVGINRIANN